MIFARDVMTPNPMCISANSLVAEAVEFFLKNFVSSAPVVDAHGHVLGQLSELSLMRAFVTTKVKEHSAETISDFTSLFSIPQFVGAASTLPEVVAALIRCPLHRVLVRDGGLKLVGIISPKDILRSLNGEAHESLVTKLRELENNVENLNRNLQQAKSGLGSYAQLFDSSPAMIHSSDRSGMILMANPLLHEFLGYNPGELVGKTIYDIYPSTMHEVVRKSLEQLIDHGRNELTYSSFITKSGEIHRVEIISSSLKDDKGDFVGTVTLSRPLDSEMLLRALNGVLESR